MNKEKTQKLIRRINQAFAIHPFNIEDAKWEQDESKLPPLDEWSWFIDENGDIERCRFKRDAMNGFYPSPEKLQENKIIAWSEFSRSAELVEKLSGIIDYLELHPDVASEQLKTILKWLDEKEDE